MALTQISTQGIKDGTITGTDLATNVDLVDNQKLRLGNSQDLQIFHSGGDNFIKGNASTSRLFIDSCNEVQIRHLDTNGSNSEKMIVCNDDGAVELYHDNVKRIETTAIGVIISGDLKIPDNEELRLGDSNDLQIYHDGTHSYIENSEGLLLLQDTSGIRLRSDDLRLESAGGSETYATLSKDGAVALFFDNSQKFETKSTGVIITGNDASGSENLGSFFFKTASGTVRGHFDTSNDRFGLKDNVLAAYGNSNDLQIFHDGSNSFIKHNGEGDFYVQTSEASVEDLYLQAGNDLFLRVQTGEFAVKCIGNGGVEQYFNNILKTETTNSGLRVHGHIDIEDNDQIRIGTGDDLRLYHISGNSFIENVTGELIVNGNTIHLKDGGNNETLLKAIANGGVELYFDNSKKCETRSNGLGVEGDLTLQGGSRDKFIGGNANNLELGTYSSSNTSRDVHLSIDSAGNCGVGVASPETRLHVESSDSHASEHFLNSNAQLLISNTSSHANAKAVIKLEGNAGIVYGAGSSILLFNDRQHERMRLDSGGRLCIGMNASVNSSKLNIGQNGSHITCRSFDTGTYNSVIFRSANTNIGRISFNSGAVAYNNTMSDRSLKKNFETWNENVLDLFKNINPQKFNFIHQSDETNKTKGFIAQEMVDSFPEAYTKGDEEDDKYAFNPSGMVVYLMKAIQELEAEVAALKAG